MMKKSCLLILLVLLMTACAKIVTPVGGPKDVTPPKVVKEQPANRSLHFHDKAIKITFNEFVVLNNPSKTVVVSPPLGTNPELELVGKTVVIKLQDSLRQNTTYSIVLAETIKDYTEGNTIPIYEYTFSTGALIDSFMLEGKIIDAKTLKPVKDVLVFLYDKDVDSLPKTTRPTYLTKTQSNGVFTFSNIKKDNYKIFALDDINSNLIYDLPNEKIAFADETCSSWPMPLPKDTTVKADSVVVEEPVVGDSLESETQHPEIILSLFEEKDTNLVMMKYVNSKENIYQFPYKTDFKSFSSRHLSGQELSYFQVVAPTRDTVAWYLKEAIEDTSSYEFTVNETHVDTVQIKPFKKLGKTNNRKQEIPKLAVKLLNQGDIFKPVCLSFSYPVKPTGDFEVMLVKLLKSGHDTIYQRYAIPDTLLFSLPIDYQFEQKIPYQLFIRDSVFFGYDGTANDTVNVRFTTKSEKDYGNLQMNYLVKDQSCQYVVFLLNSKESIIQQNVITKDCRIDYQHLEPGNYSIKVIKDVNGNGVWDTGNYDLKIQPEPLFFYDKPINIRGYWDLEEDFDLE